MDEPKFYGVDLGWMQAQWRDCADKAEQLKIFRDMTGGKATVQQILEAVGEPDYMGPEVSKRDYRRWTPEEEETVARMLAENRSTREIADAVGRSEKKVQFKIARIRKEMKAKEQRKPEESAPASYPDGDALPLEIGGIPGADALETVGQTLRALLDEEEMLCDRLAVVQEMLEKYRRELAELLAMAGGGLSD